MQNTIIIISMIFLGLSSKGGNKRILAVIGASCLTIEIVYRFNIDIALYYAVCAMISSFTALDSIKLKTTCGKVLAILMLMQAMLCFSLVPDWGYSLNNLLQFKLKDFNVMMTFILIAIGVIGSDNTFNVKRTDNTS